MLQVGPANSRLCMRDLGGEPAHWPARAPARTALDLLLQQLACRTGATEFSFETSGALGCGSGGCAGQPCIDLTKPLALKWSARAIVTLTLLWY